MLRFFRKIFFTFSTLCISLLLGHSALAQDTPKQEPKTNYSQLFPNPTGTNGYEDLVMAYDLILASDVYPTPDAEGHFPPFSLSAQRKALADSKAKRALELLHTAFTKPIVSPFRSSEVFLTADNEPVFSDAMGYVLSYLLQSAQYIALADGKVGEAIDLMNEAVQLSHNVQQEVHPEGISLMDASISLMAQKINQLSLGNSERVERLCGEWLHAPNSATAFFQRERTIKISSDQMPLKRRLEILKMRIEQADINAGIPLTAQQKEALSDYITQHPEGVEAICAKVLQSTTAYYDALLEQVKHDAWERKPVPLPTLEGLTKTLWSLTFNSSYLLLLVSDYDKESASLHLLGTHAALVHYRWIHDRLPDTLDELRVSPTLTLDPFTGKPLCYKRAGDTYDLHSVGPFDSDDYLHPTEKRVPLYLPHRENQEASETPAP